MIATTVLVTIVAAYLTPSAAEPPSASYLPSSYSTMSQHSFAPPVPSFGLTAPSAFSTQFSTISGGYSAPTATYGPPKPVYVTPKPVYAPPPVKKYLPAAPAPFKLPTTTYVAPAAAPTPLYGPPQTNYHHEEYHSEPAHYEYHYDVHDSHYGTDFGHKEQRQGDVTQGKYMVLLPDGRRQIVEYIADKNGYRPTIRYEGHAQVLGTGGGFAGYP